MKTIDKYIIEKLTDNNVINKLYNVICDTFANNFTDANKILNADNDMHLFGGKICTWISGEGVLSYTNNDRKIDMIYMGVYPDDSIQLQFADDPKYLEQSGFTYENMLKIFDLNDNDWKALKNNIIKTFKAKEVKGKKNDRYSIYYKFRCKK
jgi:hypothetical protein